MNHSDLQHRPHSRSPEGASPQGLSVELMRHYADVLRLLTEHVVGTLPRPDGAVAPVVAAPEPREPVPADPEPPWEAALDLLRSRDWTQERVVALWLHPCYVLGTYALLAVGVSMHGPRRVLDLVESAPEDEARIAAFLEGLQARGIRADRGLLCTVASAGALPRAVRTVWGSAVALQRCLRTKTEEVVGLLEPDEARRIRHRLRLAWMREQARQAEEELRALLSHLQRVNRSAAQQLREGLEETLTLQRTGLLLTVEHGLRVMHTPQALIRRLSRQIPTGPAHQRMARLAAGLLELEPTLRSVAAYADLPQLQTALFKLTRTHENTP